jgi:hypothetical protein
VLSVSFLDHLRVTGLEPSTVTCWHAFADRVVRGREHFNQGQPACPHGSLINIASADTPFAHSCQFSNCVHFGTAVTVEMFNLLQVYVFFGGGVMLHVPSSAVLVFGYCVECADSSGRSLAGMAGSNPARGHGWLSRASIVYCQVEVCASG